MTVAKATAEAWRLKVTMAATWRLVVLGFARMGFGYRLMLRCLFWVFLGFKSMLRCCSTTAQPSTLTLLPFFPFTISLSRTHICSLLSNQTQSRQRKIKTTKIHNNIHEPRFALSFSLSHPDLLSLSHEPRFTSNIYQLLENSFSCVLLLLFAIFGFRSELLTCFCFYLCVWFPM